MRAKHRGVHFSTPRSFFARACREADLGPDSVTSELLAQVNSRTQQTTALPTGFAGAEIVANCQPVRT